MRKLHINRNLSFPVPNTLQNLNYFSSLSHSTLFLSISLHSTVMKTTLVDCSIQLATPTTCNTQQPTTYPSHQHHNHHVNGRSLQSKQPDPLITSTIQFTVFPILHPIANNLKLLFLVCLRCLYNLQLTCTNRPFTNGAQFSISKGDDAQGNAINVKALKRLVQLQIC